MKPTVRICNLTDKYLFLKIFEDMEKELSVHCGKLTDSFEKLQELCEKEAAKLAAKLDIASGTDVEVAFWTKDFPELIGIGRFSKKDDGSVTYDLDFSVATL